MKLNQIFEAITKMSKHDIGMGMTAYQNDEIVLVGGFRSGGSSSEYTRLKYLVYDISTVSPAEAQENSDEYEVGFVEVFVLSSGKIDGLVNIELKPKFRRGGFGKKVIKSLMLTTGSDLKIFDIKKKALSFWIKMGVEFYKSIEFKVKLDNPPRKQLTLMSKFGLYGIIPK